MNPTITILLLAVGVTFALLAYREQSRALRAEHERDVLRRLYLDSMNALSAQQGDLDERDAELERLRQVRCEYVQHLIESNRPSAHVLRRESWEN